jgi:hypothetical protein
MPSKASKPLERIPRKRSFARITGLSHVGKSGLMRMSVACGRPQPSMTSATTISVSLLTEGTYDSKTHQKWRKWAVRGFVPVHRIHRTNPRSTANFKHDEMERGVLLQHLQEPEKSIQTELVYAK